MKYYFDRRFSVVTKGRFVNFIKYLFEHYDQFCKEVIGDDFENSVYRKSLYPTAEYEYYVFRRHRAFDYQQARRRGSAYVVKPLPSFSAFELGFKKPVIDAELSSMRLFIMGMDNILMSSSIVHDHKGMCFKEHGNNRELFDDAVMEAISERYPLLLRGRKLDDFLDFRTYNKLREPVELRPVYVFIFRLIREMKLDFKYGEISRKVFGNIMSELNRIWLEHQVKEILKSNSEEKFAEEMDEEDYEILLNEQERTAKRMDEKRMLDSMKIPQVVEAYVSVYEKLPANFPVEE